MLPSGALRVGVDTRFIAASDIFATSGRVPLGASLSGLIGTSSLSLLQSLENTIQSLSGVSAFRVSLGTGRANLRQSRAVIPLEIAVGLTSNLTFRASAPFHTGAFDAQWLIDTTGATVGINPGQLAAGPGVLNGALVSNLDTAAAQLERLADGCVINALSDPRCTLVIAEMTQVRALITQSRGVTDGIASTYGGRTNTTASLFVPRTGSATQAGVASQIDGLRTGFERYGTTSVAPGAEPVAASAPATVTELRALLADSAYGYVLAPFSRRYAQGIGDVDVGITVQLFNGIASSRDPWVRNTQPGIALRQSVGLTYRIGTGSGADPDDPFRIPTGDGQDDIEITSITDIIFGAHAWATLSARFTSQRPFDGIARIPDASGSLFVPIARRRQSRTELGDRLEIALAPRWVLNDYLSFGARWRWMRQDGIEVAELPPFAGATAMTYSGPALTAHEASVGFSWSSVGPWRRNKARWPLEIQWTRSVVVDGSPGVLRATSDQISLRAYARLWGK